MKVRWQRKREKRGSEKNIKSEGMQGMAGHTEINGE